MNTTLVSTVLLTLSLALASSQNSQAQSFTRTCSVTAAEAGDQPRLTLVDSRTGDSSTTYIQLNGTTEIDGKLDLVTVKVAPFDIEIEIQGLASKSGGYFRAYVSGADWSALLRRVKDGENITLTSGGVSSTTSLVGSGALVKALHRCVD